jgi:ribosomal-protein-alanine N-acetyltransferase
VIRTARLILRDWRDEDLEPYAALNADPRVMKHFPSVLSREESDAGAARIREHLAERGFGLWAAEVIGGAPFIGFVGLCVPRWSASPCVEIGWRLARDAWGHGYATEGARAALAFGFGELGLEEIVAIAVVANDRSRAVMRRLGMVQDGELDHPFIPEGNPVRRHVLYRIRRGAADRPAVPAAPGSMSK